MGEWKPDKLGDVADLATGFPFKSREYVHDVNSPRLLRGDNIAQGQIRWAGVKRWPANKTQELDQYWLAEGDVVLAMDRPWIEAGLKYCAVSQEDLPSLLVQRVARLRGTKRLTNSYLRYVIGSPAFTSHILAVQTGSVVPHISNKSISEFEFKLPPLPEQRAIASVLCALDDKIALNRRMNETLEGLARALFKDWFVDFGPTRAKQEARSAAGTTGNAKMAGAKPYLPLEIWSLFPDRLDDNGVPEGWEEQTIGDNFDVTMGQSPPGSTYNEDGEGLPFFQGRRDFEFRFPSRRVFCTKPSRIASKDWTLLSVRAPVGDINRAWEECAIGRGVAAFMHKSGYASLTYYVGLHLREQLASYDSEGTVFGSINQKQFKALKALTASPQTMNAFEDIVAPLDKIIRNNTAESRTLAQTRDLLLPKLMSGVLRVGAAEKIVEGAL